MKQGIFSAQTLFLCVAASVLARCFLEAEKAVSFRALLLRGGLAALALCLLSALCMAEEADRALFSGASPLCRLGRVFFALWFGKELAETLLAAQTLCREEFGSMAVLGVFPFLLWAGWSLRASAFDRSAKILLGLSAAGVVLLLAGTQGQLAWQRLFSARKGGMPELPVFAEFFALPLLCPPDEQKKAVWLPLGAFAVQAADCLLVELAFGGSACGRSMELLRAAALGAFSRFDAVFLLLWLAVGFFRVSVLTRAIRMLWEQRRRPEGQEAAP